MNTKIAIGGLIVIIFIAIGAFAFGGNTTDVVQEGDITGTSLEGSEPVNDTPDAPILPSATKTVTVTYSDTGFSPKTVMIAKGDTVRFVNESSRRMWVASDLHPTHDIYPAFDDKKAIEKGQVYTFVFDQIGTWNYHDHARASMVGTVIVK